MAEEVETGGNDGESESLEENRSGDGEQQGGTMTCTKEEIQK